MMTCGVFPILVFLLIVSCCQATTSKSNKESLSIKRAKQLKEYFRLHPLPAQRKPLLIATFLNASKPTSRKTLQSNLAVMNRSGVDFAIIAYDGDFETMSSLCNLDKIGAKIIHCRRPVISYSPEHHSIPKPLLYPELSPYLPSYQRTLLIDEDIHLSVFNQTEFLTIWECAFYPQFPPLLVQGLLYEPDQRYSFLHWKTWKRPANLSMIVASGSFFLEQQIPAFDSLFLLWFIESVLPFTFPTTIRSENGWGLDYYWCAAAQAFAKHFYSVSSQNTTTRYTSCALITGTSGFHHLDGRTIAIKYIGKYSKFMRDGFKQLRTWRTLFPRWKASLADPSLLDNQHLFRSSRGLPSTCPLRYGPVRSSLFLQTATDSPSNNNNNNNNNSNSNSTRRNRSNNNNHNHASLALPNQSAASSSSHPNHHHHHQTKTRSSSNSNANLEEGIVLKEEEERLIRASDASLQKLVDIA